MTLSSLQGTDATLLALGERWQLANARYDDAASCQAPTTALCQEVDRLAEEIRGTPAESEAGIRVKLAVVAAGLDEDGGDGRAASECALSLAQDLIRLGQGWKGIPASA